MQFYKVKGARKVSLPGAEKCKKLAESPVHGCPQLAYDHGCWPSRGQVELRTRSGCLFRVKPGPLPPVLLIYNSVQDNLKISSHGITEPAPLGISWSKKRSGHAGRVRQFPSYQMPRHHQLPLALPAQPSHRCLLCHLLQESSSQQGVLGSLRAICVPDLQVNFLVGPSPLRVQLAMIAEGDLWAGQGWVGRPASRPPPQGKKTGPLKHWPKAGRRLPEAETATRSFSYRLCTQPHSLSWGKSPPAFRALQRGTVSQRVRVKWYSLLEGIKCQWIMELPKLGSHQSVGK